MKPLLALSLLLLALGARAECPRSYPDQAPAVVDGSTATADAMLRARDATQDYVQDIESFLQCWAALLTTHSHNRLVDRAMEAAEAYNSQLRQFRQREELAAR